MKRIYEFRLKFAVPVRTAEPHDWIDSLAEAGCDDTLIGAGIPGRLALDFDRVAAHADSSFRRAVADVQRAIPEARPDYVGLTEISEVLGISRQTVRKIMANNIETFPLPVHEGSPSIWHLKNVLGWMREEQGWEIDAPIEEISAVTCRVNSDRRVVTA